jgi:amidase
MRNEDALAIGRLDAHDQAALLRSGEISGVELVDAAIARIELFDPALNATTHRAFDEARKRAAVAGSHAGLRGVPYLLKDGLDYIGMPTRSGSRLHARGPAAQSDFEYSRRLDAAGLVPLGKSNVPEFGLLPTTESLLYGPARNPWARDRSPGGSSGGAAVAVASGMVPLAHAADGGGSIRIPASCCGVVGLKPGRGANVRAREHHILEDLLVGDVLLSRSVRDVAWAFAAAHPTRQATVGAREPLKRLRVAFIPQNLFGEPPHPEVAAVARRAAELCAGLGHLVEEARYPFDAPATANAFRTLWEYLAHEVVERCRPLAGSAALASVLEPWTLGLAQWSRRLGAADLGAAMRHIAQATDGLERLFTRYDVILSPVLKEPAVAIGRLGPDREFEALVREMFDYVSYTPLHNLTGTPAISLPLFAASDGVPIGSMFAAARGGEALLLQLAYELEQALPWSSRWPPRPG